MPAQAAIARSAKWGTTEPSGRPSPSRQGSQGSGQLDAMGSVGSGWCLCITQLLHQKEHLRSEF